MPMDTSLSIQEPVATKPKMASGRKSSKPLMEKRRRARINDSLGQLKSLILEATNKDTSRHSKLEKADILEMTVKYLRNMQRHHLTGAINNDSAELNRYRLGYSECITEVSRYLDSSQSAVQLRTQLIGHLANRVSPPPSPIPQQQQQPHSIAFTPAPTPAPVVATAAMVPPPSSHSVQVQVAQSPVTSVPSVTVPSGAITSGEIRVVLPSEALPGGQLPSHFIPVYAHGTPSLSSMDTPPSPTTLQTPQPSFRQIQELPSPVSYDQHHMQQQTVPLSYMVGVAPTASPLVGSIAPAMAVQTPTLIAKPADVHAQISRTELSIPTQTKQLEIQQPQPQPHPYYHPHQNALRTANMNAQQQFAVGSADECVWRPWLARV